MFRVTWRGVRQHPVRFVLSVLAVVLGIAFVTGTFALRGVMADTFHAIVDSSMDADAYVRGVPTTTDGAASSGGDLVSTSSGRTDIPLDLLDAAEPIAGAAGVFPTVQGTVILVGADGTAVQGAGGGAPSIGFAAWPGDPSLSVVAGRAPASAGEIALETSALERSGLHVGDATKLVVGGEVQDVRVVGEVGFPGASGAILVAVDPTTAVATFAPDGTVPSIAVYAADGTTPDQLAAAVSADLRAEAGSVQVVTGDTVRDEAKASIDTTLGFVSTFLLVFAAIALFVGGFIIANTFTMSVRQRMQEIAVLRAIGASPAQVFASVVGQAAIVGAVGAAVGVLAGAGLVAALREILDRAGMTLSGGVPIGASTVAVALVTGVVVSIVAAALPARRAARIPPVDAMREAVTSGDRPLRLRGVLGLVLVLLGVAAVVAATQVDDGAGSLLGIAAVLLVVGMLVWAPAIATAVVRVLAWPVVRLGRPIGALARGNVVRNPRRTASTAGALMIGMALVGAAAVLATSTQASMRSVVDESITADYLLQSASQDIPVGAADAATAVPGVASAGRVWWGPTAIDDEPSYVLAVSDGLFGHGWDLKAVEGSVSSLESGQVLVQRSAAEANGWTLGSTLTFAGSAGATAAGAQEADRAAGQDAAPGRAATTTATVGGIIESPAVGAPVVVPQALFEQLVPQTRRTLDMVMIDAAPGTDLPALRTALVHAVKPYLIVSVMDSDEFASSLAQQVQQVLVILYALLALSIVIAVLGIVNTLALSIMERTREIGLMRAVGLGRLQLAAVVIVESVLIAVFGAVAGLAVGVGLASAMPSAFADSGLSDLVVPWGSLLGMVVLAAVVGVVAAAWPAVRAARLPVLESVTYD